MSRRTALITYAAAVAAAVSGVAAAAAAFPGGFDWAYSVISKLGSAKHNPDGAAWLSAGLLVAMILLWPLVGRMRPPAGAAPARVTIGALRVGIACAALLAVEGLFALRFSDVVRKGHEALALLTLAGFYAGVLGLYVQRVRQHGRNLAPALLVLSPLAAIGAVQLILFFDQRDLGWVNTAWREMGIPLWLSFAFWQWLAVALLGAAMGHLLLTGRTDCGTRTN